MSHRSLPSAGFTLVELVVVIVLTAIVSSFIVMFLDAPIESYFAQTRRSDLVDSANRIAAAVTADVRTALPNSLRRRAVGASTGLELLATEGTARYYGKGDKNNAMNGLLPEELTIGSASPGFGTLDSFSPGALAPAAYLSVGNLGTAAPAVYDAYSAGNGVMTGVRATVGPNPSAPPYTAGENFVTLGAGMTFQAPGAPGTQPAVHNAYLVTGPVSYVCQPNARTPSSGTLMRYSGYAVTPVEPVPPGGVGALIAHDVAACTVTIVPAPLGYPYGEIAILTITLSSNGESVQVFLEAPTEYSQ